ncbi:MAG: aminomethyl-transferring glycine dehydrogenase subunit GcvPB [Candidatus Latescibacterota bacterium]|nr:MAG: aminomethyl-transferring glycine dehydrogenase subunit GcvPB [Candidatus Latescibacterota bacterium]
MARTIFEKSRAGRRGYRFSGEPAPAPSGIPDSYLRKQAAGLPEVSEPEVMRHYVALSTLNHHVDKDLYPLGSCTMKYNPKLNEDVAAIKGFAGLHPEQRDDDTQGALEVIHLLEEKLCAITGMDRFTLSAAAGAHGELLGMLLAKKYFVDRKQNRRKVLVPDSAHGTNPASAHLVGFQNQALPSGENGEVDLDVLNRNLDDETAVFMLTVPNTLGIFESRIGEIIELVHAKGALCYLDGANLNALLGWARPGDMGFDIIHVNLHKTFSTPHGGGGPGSGPVGVKEALAPLLPEPRVRRENGRYVLAADGAESVGAIHSFYGNFGIYLRALSYIIRHGGDGLRRISAAANLNANYVAHALDGLYPIPHGKRCMHEFVASGEPFKKYGVRTLDIAKRLMDFGFHAPTVYFPLIVPEALMIEPTETESKETLDRFIDAMRQIAKEAAENPELLQTAPHNTPVRRLDEVTANRKPILTAPLEDSTG